MNETKRGNALVTGGARGIGRAIAIQLAASGFDVAVNDLPGAPGLEAAVAAVEAVGRRAIALPGDIADIAGHEGLVAAACEALGELDCLVNNAGISVAQRGDILNVGPESFDRLIAVNLRGPFFLTQAVARRMMASPAGPFRSIVTISSINVEFASPDRAEYCLSKSALAMMSELYALRLAEAGIRCYEVRPGVIRTQMTDVARERYDRRFAEGLAPIARWGEPEDVGRAVATLASGVLGYSTGEVIRVDGGMAIRRL